MKNKLKKITLIIVLFIITSIIYSFLREIFMRNKIEKFLKTEYSSTSFSRNNLTYYPFKCDSIEIYTKKCLKDSSCKWISGYSDNLGVVDFDVADYLYKKIRVYYYESAYLSYDGKTYKNMDVVFYTFHNKIIGIAIMDYSKDVLYNKEFKSFEELHPEGSEEFQQNLIKKLE